MTDLGHLSDDELLSEVGGIIGSQRRLLRALQEVEDRRLHLRLAHSSMFDFCTRRLSMSEGEAYRRIAVARLARRYPEIIELIATGAVYITTVMILRDHLDDDNHEELLRDISGKDTAQVEAYIAQRFPKPDAPSAITARARRAVFQRDGEQCTFVGEDGRRCEGKAFLTLDHIEPESLGGTGDNENLRFCEPHNLFEAERIFGKEYVAARIRQRRERRRAAKGSAADGPR